ncbi:helix-turn-helix domain-containing protein [Bradyrhizobium sp. 179]|uniref:helix-turn-helix domain-containing protein n=1 Tax=Bradyrhizobium sp. 179 TaxID=2782648 RepID=UPI001FF853D4|nr:helix-turn-helix domain-containing protein [Bradyrhizobium sp. 179]MCK1542043.1 helix-turn-helix domain-containing protein [Bradyrhizobium sp. 179]
MKPAAQKQAQARALTVDEFCREYRIGRTTFYQQVRLGHLRVRKIGKRSLIATEDAEAWFRTLDVAEPASLASAPINSNR